jgi:hypothetical protein
MRPKVANRRRIKPPNEMRKEVGLASTPPASKEARMNNVVRNYI